MSLYHIAFRQEFRCCLCIAKLCCGLNGKLKCILYVPLKVFDPQQIKEDAKRLHIDVEYAGAPIYVNNFNMNMDEFLDMGQVVTTKDFLDKIAQVDVEKA